MLDKMFDGSLSGFWLFVAVCGVGALAVTGVMMLCLPW